MTADQPRAFMAPDMVPKAWTIVLMGKAIMKDICIARSAETSVTSLDNQL
jgi:hypothetical protein